MPDSGLSVTICSWNTRQDLRACLLSLRACRDEADFEVVVVENASRDGSGEMVAEEFPEFRLLQQTENLGFTGGHNLAIRERRKHHVALLNSDTVVHPGALRQIVAYMEAHPEAGIVGPRLLNPDGSLQYSCRHFPNPVAAAFRNTLLGRVFPNNRFTRDYLMTDWDHRGPREVDWVSGAAMFVRAEVVEQVGLLDDTLFMFCEDVDLCKRAWQAGFKVVYLPTAEITHAIGRSTDRAPFRTVVRFHRSMFRYYLKHDVRSAHPLARPFLVAFAFLGLVFRAGVFLMRNLLATLGRREAR